MRLWPLGKRNDLNTIQLTGDWDDIELVEEVERAFGIEISDDEAYKTITVGELEELIRAKFTGNGQNDALWRLLCRIVREYSGHKGSIDRETTFFAEHAKERMSNGQSRN